MLLADSSAWVEFLRGTNSPAAVRLRAAIARSEVTVIDPILLEVLAGMRSALVPRTQQLLEAQRFEALVPRQDWLAAASLYRHLRRHGLTVRSQVDALIAAVALRLGIPVLHRDRDFDSIAQCSDLRVATA